MGNVCDVHGYCTLFLGLCCEVFLILEAGFGMSLLAGALLEELYYAYCIYIYTMLVSRSQTLSGYVRLIPCSEASLFSYQSLLGFVCILVP